jgi:ketosteroid isomerase-like protein
MNKEMILKLLASLGVKVSADGKDGMKEDDAVKLVEDLFAAGNLGLIQKRDELLKQEKELKEKIAGMESTANETVKKQAELEAQLKKANPEEYKKFYEGKTKELEAQHKTELEKVTTELNRFRDSHYERVRGDAVTAATKDIKFINDALKEGFIALALSKNQFTPHDIDGKTIFTNQSNETIEAVLRQFALSNEGKAYIQNDSQGGGAAGGNERGGSGQGGTKITRAEFDNMSDQARSDFFSKGGSVTD